MACLGSVQYDPAGAVTKATDSNIAMTAFDTTNARITFTAPANGIVLSKIRVSCVGGTATPQLLFGVLDGATVRGRVAMFAQRMISATVPIAMEGVSLITGLTPAASYTFDAAYGVETGVASSTIRYGGPNNTTSNDAGGALSFEIWETDDLLAGVHYDPGTAVSVATTAGTVMTAVDTTNLRLSFTGPPSGKVLVRVRTTVHGNTGHPALLLGALDGATVKMRQIASGSQLAASATDIIARESIAVVDVTPTTSYTWDAAYGVEAHVTSTGMKYGGPNNTTANDAFGGFGFEVWKA